MTGNIRDVEDKRKDESEMNRIFVDADACPVKEEVYKVAVRNNIEVSVVSNGGIRPHPHPLIKIQVVAEGLDVADDWIADQAKSKDLVITNDILLAARCIKKGVNVFKPDGTKLDSSNIGATVATRNLMYELRSKNPFLQGNSKTFSNRDRSNFLIILENEVRKLI